LASSYKIVYITVTLCGVFMHNFYSNQFTYKSIQPYFRDLNTFFDINLKENIFVV